MLDYSQNKAFTEFVDKNKENLKEKLGEVNNKNELKVLAVLSQFNDMWFQAIEVGELIDISRTTVLKYANQLYELDFLERGIVSGTEKKSRPTYKYRLKANLDTKQVKQFIHRKGYGSYLNLLEENDKNHSSTQKTKERDFLEETHEQVDQYLNSLKEKKQELKSEFEKEKPVNHNITLDEVWFFVEETTKIFSEKLAEQEERIIELERKLSLTRAKGSSSPTEQLSEIRNRLNVKKSKSS